MQQSQTNHKLAIANGSTDPTFGAWYTYNSSNNNPNGIQTLGASVSIPLRIFDQNQGEKKRTQIDIDRSQQASEAARAQVFSDVDSAYELVRSNIALLKPYKAKYNDQALRVRDTVTYAYQHGGASLMDFLNAQSDYRQVQLAYAQLIGAYLTAAGTTESCRRTRGNSMTKTSLFRTACFLAAGLALAGCKKKFRPGQRSGLSRAGGGDRQRGSGVRGPSGPISHWWRRAASTSRTS